MRRRHALVVAGVIVLIVLLTGLIARSRTFLLFGDTITRVKTRQKAVALTFDDGPTPAMTAEILGILRREKVKATFFVNGETLAENPEPGRSIVAAGHQMGNHTYSHKPMIFRSPRATRNEILRTDRLIRETGYRGEILVRPPYCLKLVILPRYMAKQGRKIVTWDVGPDMNPWVEARPSRITRFVLKKTRPGSIIMMHVISKNHRESMHAVEDVIAGLKENGYRFVTVSELLTLGPTE